eukprot:scaffold12546_cov54-Cylindrotheca_fusiformis.AAC.1
MARKSSNKRKRKRDQESNHYATTANDNNLGVQEEEGNGESPWMFLPVAWTAVPSSKKRRRISSHSALKDSSFRSGIDFPSSANNDRQQEKEEAAPAKFLTISWQWFNEMSHWNRIECCIRDPKVTVEE